MRRVVIQGVGPAAVGTYHQLAVAVGFALRAGDKQVVGAVHIGRLQGTFRHLRRGVRRQRVFFHCAAVIATDHGRVIISALDGDGDGLVGAVGRF